MDYTKMMQRYAPKFELTGFAVPRESQDVILPSIVWPGGQVVLQSELLSPYLQEQACVHVRGFLRSDRGVRLNLDVESVDLVPEDRVSRKILGQFNAVSSDWLKLQPWQFEENGKLQKGIALIMEVLGGQLRFSTTIGDGIKIEPGALDAEVQGIQLTTRNKTIRRAVGDSYQVLEIIPARVFAVRSDRAERKPAKDEGVQK